MRTENLGSAPRTSHRTLALIDLGGRPARVSTPMRTSNASDACARGLLRRGLQRGERVAILAANRAEYLIAFLGIMRAGLVSVPVNHRLPAGTVGFIMMIATRNLSCDAVPVPCSRRLALGGAAADWATLLDEGPFSAVQPCRGIRRCSSTHLVDRAAERRGAVAPEATSGCWRCAAPPTPGPRVLVAAPLYHMNALAMSQATLNNGGTIVLLPGFNAAGLSMQRRAIG